MLDTDETIYESPPQTTRTSYSSRTRNKPLSKILRINWKKITDVEVSQIAKLGIQILLAWIIIDSFQHNINLTEQSRKQFHTYYDKDTILADETHYVWDQKWHHDVCFNIPNDIPAEKFKLFK